MRASRPLVGGVLPKTWTAWTVWTACLQAVSFFFFVTTWDGKLSQREGRDIVNCSKARPSVSRTPSDAEIVRIKKQSTSRTDSIDASALQRSLTASVRAIGCHRHDVSSELRPHGDYREGEFPAHGEEASIEPHGSAEVFLFLTESSVLHLDPVRQDYAERSSIVRRQRGCSTLDEVPGIRLDEHTSSIRTQ